MTAPSRAPQGAGSQESERSPFARLTELLAPYQPAKPLITLSLGEPQHPVPGFVGPVLAKHTAEFGRYPIARGIEICGRGFRGLRESASSPSASGRPTGANRGCHRGSIPDPGRAPSP